MRKSVIVLPLLLILAASLACARADVPTSASVPDSPTATPFLPETAVPTEAPPVVLTSEPTSEPTPTATPVPTFFLREEVMSGRVVLEIPRIEVESGLRMAEVVKKPDGTTYLTKPSEYPLWVPGWGAEIGNVGVALIYGHRQWGPVGKVFTALNKREPGDIIRFRYRGEVIEFAVTETVVVEPDQLWPLFILRDDAALAERKIQVALWTCTPWGTDWQRLVVFAELATPNSPEEVE